MISYTWCSHNHRRAVCFSVWLLLLSGGPGGLLTSLLLAEQATKQDQTSLSQAPGKKKEKGSSPVPQLPAKKKAPPTQARPKPKPSKKRAGHTRQARAQKKREERAKKFEKKRAERARKQEKKSPPNKVEKGKTQQAKKSKQPLKRQGLPQRKRSLSMGYDAATQLAVKQYNNAMKAVGISPLFEVIHERYAHYAKRQRASVVKYGTMWSPESMEALVYFEGQKHHPYQAFLPLALQELRTSSYMVNYMFLIDVATANADLERAQRNQALIRYLKEHPKIAHELASLYDDMGQLEVMILSFFLRDEKEDQVSAMIKDVVRVDKIIPGLFLDGVKRFLGYDLRTTLERIPVVLFWAKFMNVEAEALMMGQVATEDLTLAHKWFGEFTSHGFGLFGEGGDPRYKVSTDNTAIGTIVNAFFGFVSSGLRRVLGGGLIPGPEAFRLSNLKPGELFSWKLLLLPFWIPACLEAGMITLPRLLLKAVDHVDHAYRYYQGYVSTLRRLHTGVNLALETLHCMRELVRRLAKLQKIVEGEPELHRLLGNDLAPISSLRRKQKGKFVNKKFFRLLKQVGRLPESLSMRDLFNPSYNSPIAHTLRLFRQIDRTPSSKLDKAFYAMYCLAPHAILARDLMISELSKQRPKAFVELLDSQDGKTVVAFDSIWSPINTVAKVIKNDVLLFRTPQEQSRSVMVITGPNGSGKTMYVKSVSQMIPFSAVYGIGYCAGGRLTPPDYLRAFFGVTDRHLQDSTFMAQARSLQATLQLVKKKNPQELLFIAMDEPLGGTPEQEGCALLLASLNKIARDKGNGRTLAMVTTHLESISTFTQLAQGKGMATDALAFYTTGFDPEKGFTYQIHPGKRTHPASVYILGQMQFDKQVREHMIELLRDAPSYPHKELLPAPPKSQQKTKPRSWWWWWG